MKPDDILSSFSRLAADYLRENSNPETPVAPALSPGELSANLDLGIGEAGKPVETILDDVKLYLRHSVRTGHPQFFNQLFAGFSLPGFLGEATAALSNTSMYTYEVAPLATLIEKSLVKKMCSLLGFKNGEGIFTTGGSNSNLVALFAARHRAFPDSKKKGMRGASDAAFFVSEEAHYSFAKAANILGLGTESCVKVAVDDSGRMRAGALETAIRAARDSGRTPFFVAGTAGTTVRGAFDPLPELAETAARHKVWFHVDGAWGGSVILSQKHRRLLEGVELADSVAWDAHKMMGAPLIASVILFNRSGVLRPINDTSGADYLFHAEDESFDLGQLSLQCGRRVDALKLWLMWRHLGDRGFEEKIDRLFSLAAHAVGKIKSHPELRLAETPPSLNLCFRYEPKAGSRTPEAVDALNIQLREKLYQNKKSLVNYARVKGRVVIRLILVNFDLKEADLDRFFEEVVRMGDELSAGALP